MASELSRLFITIGARTDAFQKDMQGVTKSLQKVGAVMAGVGGAIVGAMALSVKSFAQAGDEVQKMALRTGFGTEALSELRHAANLSGTSLESMEIGIKRMQSTLIDASDGLETAVRAFDKLGLSYEQLRALTPEQQFMAITSALADIEDPTLKSALAVDIFGRSGTDMLPMLADGADGLERMRQEAHDLGIVFSEEAAKKAAEFNDALTKLKGGLEGIKNTIAENLIPTLNTLVDSMTDVLKGMNRWADEHPGLSKFLTDLGISTGGWLVALGGVLVALPTLAKLATIVGIALLPLIGIIAGFVIGLAMITTGIIGLISNARIRREQLEQEARAEELNIQLKEEHAKACAGLENSYIALLRQAKEEGFVIGEVQEIYLASVDAYEAYLKKLGEITEGQEKLTEAMIRANEQLEKQRNLMGILGKLYPKGISEKEMRLLAPILSGVEVPGLIPGTEGYYKALGIPTMDTGGLVRGPGMFAVGPGVKEVVRDIDSGYGIANLSIYLDGDILSQKLGIRLMDEIRLQGAR